MINELLNLADRLDLKTPRVFEPKPVHYFIELDGAGNLLGFSPAYGRTKKGEVDLGKTFDCPVPFPLKVDEVGKITSVRANEAPPSLLTGNTVQVLRTVVSKKGKLTVLPKDEDLDKAGAGSPSVEEDAEQSAEGTGENQEVTDAESQGNATESELSDEREADSGTTQEETEAERASDETAEDDSEKGHKRRSEWVAFHKRFFKDLESAGKLTSAHKAVRCFIEKGVSLTDEHFCELRRTIAPTEEDDQKAAEKRFKRFMQRLGQRRFAFRVNGRNLLKDTAVREFWKKQYLDDRKRVAEHLPEGFDMFGEEAQTHDLASARLTVVFPHISNVPQGGAYCPLASFDKAPFQSYGLSGATTQMTLAHAERATVALNFLLASESHSLWLSRSVKAIFWAADREKHGVEDTSFVNLISAPDPLQVLKFLSNIRGHAAEPPADTAQFYCALVSSPKARVTVRSWHTDTLPRVVGESRRYFRSITLPTRYGVEGKTSSLDDLAKSTVRPSMKNPPQPSTYAALLDTAFFGTPVPHRIFQQVIARQKLEMAKGPDGARDAVFENRLRHRIALMKLFFTKENEEMNEATHTSNDNAAHLCGRLLAILDEIHNVAHERKSASSPASRLYGAASTTPALVFPQLCRLVRYHLAKMDKGLAHKFEFGVPKEKRADGVPEDFEGLAAVVSRLNKAGKGTFPRTLPLEEQGRFAIGFYYERCREWPEYKKASNSAKTEATEEQQ
ncbi:MAG: type I-C CRISPR-associated protein Cas8c/Csd1 [Verrucomicrobia bacterium]|nr:type I-C CRISPR-associated protein Cas8c/Csd1 [Verrucomicrobiota bacterium]MBU1693356.1 type I-C CRISPR-associated protein Cas8c/Csd1 [Verrucomicrobiota bacterium]